MNVPRFRSAAVSSAIVAVMLVVGACSLIPGSESTGPVIPAIVPQARAAELARGAVQMSPTAKVTKVEQMRWAQAKEAASGLQLQGEEPMADRPVWLVSIVTVSEGPASTGGEFSQVVVDGIDGRVVAIAQVFS